MSDDLLDYFEEQPPKKPVGEEKQSYQAWGFLVITLTHVAYLGGGVEATLIRFGYYCLISYPICLLLFVLLLFITALLPQQSKKYIPFSGHFFNDVIHGLMLFVAIAWLLFDLGKNML